MMNAFERLLACAGSWRGNNTLHDPFTGEPEETSSRLTLTPILQEKFVRIDYTWSYQGTPQEGSMLVGFQPDANLFTTHWIDTWHMSHGVMACQGAAKTDDEIVVQGTYAAPPDEDWGWRIDITPSAGESIHVKMINISSDRQEYPAVEADYARALQETMKGESR